MESSIPMGSNHLNMIFDCANVTQSVHKQKLGIEGTKFELLGSSLSTLYIAATCARGCNGGNHIFERLSAKAYNGISSAYILTNTGFYDEALSITRGVGELANLLSLSFVESDKFQEWLLASPNDRKKKFSPYKIRMLLEPYKDVGFLIVDKQWYGELSEEFCHIHPNGTPNKHSLKTSVAG